MDFSTKVVLIALAAISLFVVARTMWLLLYKIHHSKRMTLTNRHNEHITISTRYNRADSRKLIEFMK